MIDTIVVSLNGIILGLMYSNFIKSEKQLKMALRLVVLFLNVSYIVRKIWIR